MRDDSNTDCGTGAQSGDGQEPASVGSRKRGRPSKLEPDDRTLGRIEGMASLLGTMEEMAKLLDVDKKTLIEFFNRHEKARAAWNRGVALRAISIRRSQLKAALKGDTKMLIYLGKKRLGQHN